MVQDELAAAARLVEERSRRPLPDGLTWNTLQPPEKERPAVAAVDGSHALLVDNGAVWVAAVRAAAVQWPGPPVDVPMSVHATLAEQAQQGVDAAYHERGLDPPPVRSADGWVEALRALAESDAADAALRALPEGSLLLLDGALERLPKAPAQLVDRLLEQAARRGIALVGVAKRSRLDLDGTPLVHAVLRAAQKDGRTGPWSVPVPGHRMTHVALLHPNGQHAFRVDATDPDALRDLLPLSRDAVYVGYPYPLAAAHNAVAISQAEARRLRDRLGDEARARGADVWAMLRDFHDVLDRNAPRS